MKLERAAVRPGFGHPLLIAHLQPVCVLVFASLGWSHSFHFKFFPPKAMASQASILFLLLNSFSLWDVPQIKDQWFFLITFQWWPLAGGLLSTASSPNPFPCFRCHSYAHSVLWITNCSMSKAIVTVLHVTYLFKFLYVYFGQLSTQANEMTQRVKCEPCPCKDRKFSLKTR